MNENTEFDLEWAKRGGLLINKGRLCKYTRGGGEQAIHISPISHSPLRILCMQQGCRMATREECESAGIEYIERPVSAEELAGLREDSEQLAFLTQQRGEDANFIDTYASGGMVKLGNGGWFKTPREAIRAAMKGGV